MVNKRERNTSVSSVSPYYDKIRRIEFRVPPAGYYPATFSLGRVLSNLAAVVAVRDVAVYPQARDGLRLSATLASCRGPVRTGNCGFR